MIRPVALSDARAICDIYNHYVLNTIVTFEEDAVPEQEMEQRIADITAKYPWLVYEEEGRVKGYAYAGPWKSRCAYRYSSECTIYLEHGLGAKGIGSQLYDALFKVLPANVHSIIGGIALPNEASVAIHEKFGFEKVAQFKEVGYKQNRWIDVGYWEKIIR